MSALRHRVYFVSGIDTDAGKTVATGLMLRHLVRAGVSCTSVKLVQTGCRGAVAEDVLEHRRLAGLGSLPEDVAGLTSPQVFAFPASPPLSARLEGRVVDVRHIEECVAKCAAARDTVLAEGAGGLLAPVADDLSGADLAAQNGWPLILATSGRLGSLNHTLLSIEAALARGLRIAGLAFGTSAGEDPRIAADTEREILRCAAQAGISLPVVHIPRLAPNAPPPDIDFGEFFA